jgi:hypothetical protein
MFELDNANHEPKIELIQKHISDVKVLLTSYDASYNAFIVLLENPPRTTSAETIDTYKQKIVNDKVALDNLYSEINTKVSAINNLINEIKSFGDANRSRVDINSTDLLKKLDEMTRSYEKLTENLMDPNSLDQKMEELDGNYEESQIKTDSNFIKYMFYLFFAIFIIGCLCLLYFFPSIENLDMFILALAAIIIVYYAYDYFQTRNM